MAANPHERNPVRSFLPGDPSLAERLEHHELVQFPTCPFALPEGDDLRFLLEQRLGPLGHKNISFDPRRDQATGFAYQTFEQAERLRSLLAQFSHNVTTWLATVLPAYAETWHLDRVSYRPEEEATRHVRVTARNDLLHIDSFPTRPTHGRRILRCFANINPDEPRVWVTTDPFPRLLERYGAQLGLPASLGLHLTTRLREGVVRLLLPRRSHRSDYDAFMLQFHDFLKMNDTFQEHCSKRYWTFPPRSAWLAFTDAVCHADLRGRFALEHSYFVPTRALFIPGASPAACLQRACGRRIINDAA
jgi:3-deoxy-D-manno-octulosonic acid hydroxylase-like protein